MYRPEQVNVGAIEAHKAGDILLNFADRQAKQYQTQTDRAMEQYKLSEDKRKWDITNSRAENQEKRAADEYARGIQKEQSTNEAIRAVMNPTKYGDEKLAIEQKAIQDSLSNLNPADRAVAEQQIKSSYNPNVSRQDWLNVANTATGVDVGKVLDTKSRQYEIAAKTPGTPEYIAAKQAEMDLYKQKAAIDSGTRRADARFEQDLIYEFDGRKVKGMLDALNVSSVKPEEYVTNDALRKNIAGKQEVYGNAYRDEIDKNLSTIESINKNTEALKNRLTGNETLDKGLLIGIKNNESKLEDIHNFADKIALGKSSMGTSVKEVPAEVIGTKDTVKSKAEFTKDMLKALGPNPSAEAVTVATQEIEKRYPKTNLSIAGYNQLAEQYGGKAITTNDPAVAKENADAAVQIHKEKLGKQLMLNPISVDDTNKSLSELFKVSSPDIAGTGDENEIRDRVYQIKAQYQIPDKQMGSIVDQTRKNYLDPWFGVNEDFVKEIEQKAAALKGTTVKTDK